MFQTSHSYEELTFPQSAELESYMFDCALRHVVSNFRSTLEASIELASGHYLQAH